MFIDSRRYTMWGGEIKEFNIHWKTFLVSFAVGILYVYISNPPQRMILKYPTPYNAGKITYRDKADTCFQFVATKVTCPTDKSKVKKQPIVM